MMHMILSVVKEVFMLSEGVPYLRSLTGQVVLSNYKYKI